MCSSQKKFHGIKVLVWRCRCVGWLTLGFSLAMASASPAVATTEIRLSAYLGPTVSLRATVNGTDGTFMFDTGGGVSSVTPAFAAKIGCSPWDRIAMFKMTGEQVNMPRCDNVRIGIGGHDTRRAVVGVFDLVALLPKEAPAIDGLFGLDVFDGQAITLDQQRGVIVIETKASLTKRMTAGRALPIRLVRDAQGLALTVDAGVQTAGGLAWMELDSGNFGGFIIGQHIAPLLSLDPKSREAQQVRLNIAGIDAAGDAEVKDLIMDGNIGQRFLRHWLLTLDLSHARAWLAPAGG